MVDLQLRRWQIPHIVGGDGGFADVNAEILPLFWKRILKGCTPRVVDVLNRHSWQGRFSGTLRCLGGRTNEVRADEEQRLCGNAAVNAEISYTEPRIR